MRRVLGHSLLCSLVRSHRLLMRLLCTACFARALRCAHSLARSLTRSLALAHGKKVFVYEMNTSISDSFNPKWGVGGGRHRIRHSFITHLLLLLRIEMFEYSIPRFIIFAVISVLRKIKSEQIIHHRQTPSMPPTPQPGPLGQPEEPERGAPVRHASAAAAAAAAAAEKGAPIEERREGMMLARRGRAGGRGRGRGSA